MPNHDPNKMPLVSFVILTYNQIDYIESSIRGALSQNYANLEIIISDDCSTDGTFERAKEIISKCDTVHKVRFYQTSENKCILGHFFEIIDVAKGELLILGAGDDISKPDRVRKTVSYWMKSSGVSFFSNYELQNADGLITNKNYSPNKESTLLRDVFNKKNAVDIHGASSAYDMNFLKSIPRIKGRFFFEDIFMTFMTATLNHEIIKTDEPLVIYRSHSSSITNRQETYKSFSEIKLAELKSLEYTRNKYDLYIQLKKTSLSLPKSKLNSDLDLNELNNYIDKICVKGTWLDKSPLTRLFYALKYHKDASLSKWLLPRTLGINCFSGLKLIKTRYF